jgi:cytochrome P450
MKEARPIPGPKGQFILGSARQFQADKLGFLKRCVEEFGDVFQFPVGPFRFVVINDLEMVQEILVDQASRYKKSALTRDIFGRLMGNGLMISEGDLHKQRRRLVQAGFDSERLRGYVEVVERHAAAVASRWRRGEEIDVEAEMARITIGATADVLFGADISPEIERLTAALVDFQNAGSALFNSGFVPPPWLPTSVNRELARAVRVVNEVLNLVILERQRMPSDRGDLLSSLLAVRADDGSPLPAEALRDELRTLFTAGIETTANALTWTWYHLSRSPDVEGRLEEALTVPHSANHPPLFGVSPYVTMVVKEALRSSNPIWAFNRSPIEPEIVKGYGLRPKDIVVISPFLLHQDPRHYQNPERFDPERFSETREREIPRLAFLPFGAGPRTCVAARFALIELGTVVSTIASRFRLELQDGRVVEPEAFVSVRPKGGLKMRVEARN